MKNDLISRQAAINALVDGLKGDEEYCTEYDVGYNDGIDFAVSRLSVLPSAEADNRLAKIADLMEGTIAHFDHEDAMDLLYQVKEALDE